VKPKRPAHLETILDCAYIVEKANGGSVFTEQFPTMEAWLAIEVAKTPTGDPASAVAPRGWTKVPDGRRRTGRLRRPWPRNSSSTSCRRRTRA
jgi:hypothetical protein